MRRTVTALAFGLLGMAALVPPAVAQNAYRGGYSDGYARSGYLPRESEATGRLCVKQCPNDMLPCDPPVYKQADGRCSGRYN